MDIRKFFGKPQAGPAGGIKKDAPAKKPKQPIADPIKKPTHSAKESTSSAKKISKPAPKEKATTSSSKASRAKTVVVDSSDEEDSIVSRPRRARKSIVVVDSDSEEDQAPTKATKPAASKKKKKVDLEDSDEDFNPEQELSATSDKNDEDDFEPELDTSKTPSHKKKGPTSTSRRLTRSTSSKKKKQKMDDSDTHSKPRTINLAGSSVDHKSSMRKRASVDSKPEVAQGDQTEKSKYFGGSGFKPKASQQLEEDPKPTPPQKKRRALPSAWSASTPATTAAPKATATVKPALVPDQITTTPSKEQPKPKAAASSAKKKNTASAKKGKTKSQVVEANDSLPLTGKTFVVTGVLDSMSREDAKDKVMALGGKVTGGVSGRTNFLVVGSVLEDGRPVNESKKHKDATRRGIPIFNEEEFLKLVEEMEGKQLKAAPELAKAPEPALPPPVAKPAAKAASSSGGGGSSGGSSGGRSAPAPSPRDPAHDLWSEKYRPGGPGDVVGNQDVLRKLLDWLGAWTGRHLTGRLPKPKFNRENPGARAALLSGPPGIGKTSMALLTARHLGYEIMELNASDARSKKSMDQKLVEAVTNTALSNGALNSRRVVIMDEVDGMAGNFDRGGIAELIKIIKTTKVPIICICNDRQAQKIRSLVNHCFDLRFRRPTPQQIRNRMLEIAAKEGISIEPNAAEMLAGSVGNDIRQVMNAMQMWAKTSSSMKFSDIKGRMSKIEKDKVLRLSNFDAAKLILTPRAQVPLQDRYEAYFVDYQLIPLLVQQNYLDAVKSSNSSKDKVETMAAAASALADADLVNTVLRRDQSWGLLPAEAACYVRAGIYADGGIGWPAFPAWMGKFSQTNKRRRLLGELGTHLNARVTGSRTELRLSYLPHLRSSAFAPLRSGKAEEAVAFLDEYGLSRDDLFELMPEFCLEEKDDPTKGLDSKAKAAFTRLYNSTVHKSQALSSEIAAPKKKKKAAAAEQAIILDDEDEAVNEEEDEGSDDNDVEVFKRKGGASKKKGTTTKTTKKQAGGGAKKKK